MDSYNERAIINIATADFYDAVVSLSGVSNQHLSEDATARLLDGFLDVVLQVSSVDQFRRAFERYDITRYLADALEEVMAQEKDDDPVADLIESMTQGVPTPFRTPEDD